MRTIISSVLLLLLATALTAQTSDTASIRGVVTDAAGARVSAATVTLDNITVPIKLMDARRKLAANVSRPQSSGPISVKSPMPGKVVKVLVKKGDDVVQVGIQKIDPTKSPKTIDVTMTEGPNKGAIMLGIYEIDGDTLKVCFDAEVKKRPTEFKSPAGSETFVNVHKRVKK